MMLSGHSYRLHRGLLLSPLQLSFNRPASHSGARVSFRSENSRLMLALPLVCGSLAASSGLERLTSLLVWFLHDLIFRHTTSLYFCLFRILLFFGCLYVLSFCSVLSVHPLVHPRPPSFLCAEQRLCVSTPPQSVVLGSGRLG